MLNLPPHAIDSCKRWLDCETPVVLIGAYVNELESTRNSALPAKQVRRQYLLSHEAWQRFLLLLPWYANGTLCDEDCKEIACWLKNNAECRVELEGMMALAHGISSKRIIVGAQSGLRRLMSLVREHALENETPNT